MPLMNPYRPILVLLTTMAVATPANADDDDRGKRRERKAEFWDGLCKIDADDGVPERRALPTVRVPRCSPLPAGRRAAQRHAANRTVPGLRPPVERADPNRLARAVAAPLQRLVARPSCAHRSGGRLADADECVVPGRRCTNATACSAPRAASLPWWWASWRLHRKTTCRRERSTLGRTSSRPSRCMTVAPSSAERLSRRDWERTLLQPDRLSTRTQFDSDRIERSLRQSCHRRRLKLRGIWHASD